MSESNDLFEKPKVEMTIEEKPKKKKNFTPEQKAAFVLRMKKAREAKLLKKAQEIAQQSQSNDSPSHVSTTNVVEEKPKKTRKPRKKKETVVSTPPQSHQYDYTYINNLNQSINMLNNNLMNLSRSQSQQSQPKPQVEKEKEIKKEPLKEIKEKPPNIERTAEEPKQPPKMAEIHQRSSQQSSNITQKRKIWNATRRAFVYI